MLEIVTKCYRDFIWLKLFLTNNHPILDWYGVPGWHKQEVSTWLIYEHYSGFLCNMIVSVNREGRYFF